MEQKGTRVAPFEKKAANEQALSTVKAILDKNCQSQRPFSTVQRNICEVFQNILKN